MLRQMNWRVAAACGMVVVLAASASAQRGGFRGGDSTLRLLRADEVLTELKVDADQKAEIAKILEASRGDRTRPNLGDLSQEERRAKFAELREQAAKRAAETMTKIEGVLKPAQVKRLKQLGVQARGARALTSKDVAESLKLSDAQQKEIAAAIEKSSAEMREAFQGGNRENARQKFTEIRKKLDEALMGVLTDDQKKEFNNLKGEAFDLPRRTPNRQGGNRPRPQA